MNNNTDKADEILKNLKSDLRADEIIFSKDVARLTEQITQERQKWSACVDLLEKEVKRLREELNGKKE